MCTTVCLIPLKLLKHSAIMQRRTRSNSNEGFLLVQRAASVGRRLKDVQGDGHCGIHSIVDQLQQQGLHVTMQSAY